jgi:hypothetical protein
MKKKGPYVPKPRPGSKFSESEIKVIHRELHKIQKEEGVVTADSVWRRAMDGRNPKLKKFFETDTRKAAEAYWKRQAQEIIKSVELRLVGEEEGIAEFHNVRVIVQRDGADQVARGYASFDRVLASQDLRDQVCEEAYNSFLTWFSRWEKYDRVFVPSVKRPAKGLLTALKKLLARRKRGGGGKGKGKKSA